MVCSTGMSSANAPTYPVPSIQQLRKISPYVCCPFCSGEIDIKDTGAVCAKCQQSFAVKDHRLFLVSTPADAPIPKKSMEYYSDRSHWSAWRTSNEEHLVRKLSALPRSSVVLDLGAGRGFFRDTINSRFDTFLSVDFVGFELIDVVADIGGKLPFKDNSFDVVLSSNVFEHMPDTNLSLAECLRVLKPGGMLIAHTPFLMELHDEPYDFYRFTHYAINELLNKHGFTDIGIEPLSTFTDAYTHIARAYFSEALEVALAKSGWRKPFAVSLVRSARKAHSIAISIMQRARVLPTGKRHPKGYGYTAYKKR